MVVENGSAEDITMSLLTDQARNGFLFGEGKETSFLPLSVPENRSHELCLFGFATYVARSTPEGRISTEQLRNTLGIRRLPTVQRASPASALASSLLQCQGGIAPVSASIRTMLANRRIGKNDAMHLWAAVMQACHYTVAKRKTISIVVSVKIIWYIRLETKNGECFISISDPYRLGAEGCNRTLMKFLFYASASAEMGDADRRLWELALGTQANPPRRHFLSRRNKGQPASGRQSQHGTSKRKQPPRGGSGTTKGHAIFEKRANDRSPNLVTECEDFLSVDKYGIVPYFDQIGKVMGMLGRGRCGSVTRVEWEGGYAALKTFVVQKDKGETPRVLDVYEHEL